MSAFQPIEEQSPIILADGIKARAVNGERITMAVVDLAPNAISPEHRHENEQLGFIIRGSMTMRVGDEVRELHAGDTYNIPSNVEHGAAAGPEGCTAADIFAPIREDWASRDRESPSRGDWPPA
jgi:quercetin dioxygenase-like cupin family protein